MWNLLYFLTGKCYGFNVAEKTADANSFKLRQMLTGYVRKRVSGEKKSALANKSDLLSLFLDSPEIFDESAIVDELVDFLIAGTQTTQFVTQTVLAHFATNPESLKRVRDEFNSVLREAGVDRSSKSLTEILRSDLTMDMCGDLTYLGYVIQEALRLNPPGSNTTQFEFSEDVTLGESKLNVKAHNPFVILIFDVHRNSS